MSEQRIAYPDDPLMAAAWCGCVSWASGEPEILARYAEERGRPFALAVPRSGLSKAIDAATGADRAEVDAFVDWVNENLWGEDPFVEPEP